MKRLFILALLLAAAMPCFANTYTAASCSQAAVQAAVNLTSNGDTVIIPTTGGTTCTWTTGVTISGKGIDITGTGTPNTGGGTVGAGTSLTTLIESGASPFFIFSNLSFGQTAKVELLTMSTTNTGQNINGPVVFWGTCTTSGCAQVRADNLLFTTGEWEQALGGGFVVTGDVFGVVDHNTANESVSGSPPLVQISYMSWLQGTGTAGDNSFAQPDSFGTAQAMYIENNSLTGVRGSENDVPPTGRSTGGARYVCRFNTVNNMSGTGLCSAHGTAWPGANRGQRQVEVYYNTVYCNWANTSCGDMDSLDGGTGRYLSNSFNPTGGGVNQLTILDIPRFDSGFPTEQWGMCGVGSGALYDATPFNTTSQCLDQVGTGAGALMVTSNTQYASYLSSNPSCVSGSAGACWPSNALDPVYEAGETCTWVSNCSAAPGVGTTSAASSRVLANKYYYGEVSQSAQASSTSPFNGTVGTGYGTLTNRPTTCTAGVGYWATDQGTWNTYNSQEGILYTCNSGGNAWSVYYTPYTYPHPLDTGGGVTPPPTNGAFGTITVGNK